MTLPPDLLQECRRNGLDVRSDPATRMLYSTDASLYQIEPRGVVFPKNLDHLSTAVELAASYQVPILARGAGSSLAGQAVGDALVLDCSRYLDKIVEVRQGVDGEDAYAVVEPGVIVNHLNRKVAPFGLQFGPDPASGDRATMGGSLANNASGSHSINYGLFADNLLEVETVLADGSIATFGEISLAEANHNANQKLGISGIPSALYKTALDIRQNYGNIIRQKWPRTWRRASGYNLNYLIPWSPTSPPMWNNSDAQASIYPPIKPGHINLAPLMCGSEGTLAIVRRAKVRLVPNPKYRVLAVLTFDSVLEACEDTPKILENNPSAVELLPQYIIHLARSVPAYAKQLTFIQGDPAAILIVEFAGDNQQENLRKAKDLRSDVLVAETSEQQQQIWGVRKVGLGIMQSRPGDLRTHTFIEDLSVPVERLAEFVSGMDRLASNFGTRMYYYAHASAGCLHMRPILNLKTEKGIRDMRAIAQEAVDLVVRLGGATTGEHGDGLARSEWLERLYGKEIVGAFKKIKQAADPAGILNPGKIVDPPPMDRNLRYDPGYTTQPWTTTMSFEHQGGLTGAIELCNGAGVCRNFEGVMCPLFR